MNECATGEGLVKYYFEGITQNLYNFESKGRKAMAIYFFRVIQTSGISKLPIWSYEKSVSSLFQEQDVLKFDAKNVANKLDTFLSPRVYQGSL